jgi:molybdopterin synthase catalytic subunit
MKIVVKFFALARDRVGVSEANVDLPEGATVETAREAIRTRFPNTTDLLSRVAFAINQAYVPATTPLRDGDELAVIPPVSGG